MNLCAYEGCFDAKTVLVTGGAGFIGSHLTQQLTQLGAQVRVLDDFSSGSHSNLAGVEVECVEGSILNDSLLQKMTLGCQFVFHLAAFVSVPASFSDPVLCDQINCDGTRLVLNAANSATCSRVIFASSAACYGPTPKLPSAESDTAIPASPYAQSKLDAEQVLQQHALESSCDCVSLRFFNVFGERQDPASSYAAVISAFQHAILHKQKPTIYGDGTQTRDFIHVSNVIHAMLLAASHTNCLSGCVFNVGTGNSMSILEVLSIMSGQANPNVEFKPQRDGDVMHSCANIEVVSSTLGFSVLSETKCSLEQMVNPRPPSTHSPPPSRCK